MYIDYHTLISQTLPHQFATPHMNEVLDFLSGSQWLSALDPHSGNYQIAMNEEDKQLSSVH